MKAQEFTKKIFQSIKSNWFMPVIAHQVYSTDERVIGVWTDGKPVYRKVFETKMPSDGNTNRLTGVTIANVDEITGIRFIIKNNNNEINCGASSYGNTQMWYSYSENVMKINEVQSYAYNSPVKIVIEYTKTTDTPTTSKVPFEPLHEYSTEEKMVGYWIDGKAVYEKTVSLSEPFTLKNGEDWQIVDNSLSENLTLISAELFRNSGELIRARQISAKTNGLAIIATNSPGVMIIGYTLRYTKTTD